jgi:plasmid replication initiation protein
LKTDFTSYKIRNIVSLKSAYSIRLYSILKMHEKRQRYKKVKEKSYKLDELKKIL